VIGGELQHSPQPAPLNHPSVAWDDLESAFARRIRSGVISNLGHLDITSFMEDSKSLFVQEVGKILEEHPALKVNADLAAEFSVLKDKEVVNEVKYFNTENAPLYASSDLEDFFEVNINEPVQEEMQSFEQRGSGWTLNCILRLVINYNKLNQLRGSSYIPLPPEIRNKNACINVKNYRDEKCFVWAILSALHHREGNPNFVGYYHQFEHELNLNGISFPVTLKDINKFEKQNPISVNVYMLQKFSNNYKVMPCHLTNSKQENHVNLLMVQNRYIDEDADDSEFEIDEDDDDDINFHYVWIKNLSRLVRKERTKCKRAIHICDRCLSFFHDEEKLAEHEPMCIKVNKTKITLPKSGEKLKFTNFNNKERVPFVIYADFECLLKPVEEEENPNFLQKHEAHSIGFYLSCSFDPSRSRYEAYRQTEEGAKSPAEWFIEKLSEIKDEIEAVYKDIKPMSLTDEEKRAFWTAKRCHICNELFKPGEARVRDHDHLTGK